MTRHLFLILSAMICAPVLAQEPLKQAGESFRITVFHESKSKGETSSSSSSGGHEYIERIIATSEAGVERIYDVPRDPDEESRLIDWQFPVQVFEAKDGELRIVNRGDLEARRDAWLDVAEIPAEACGTWYFTWNAFQVECDPDAILETIRTINIQALRLKEGEPFTHPAASQPGNLQLLAKDGSKFRVEMIVDEDYFHRSEAKSDVIVGEIMREPVTFKEAYERRKAEKITGSIEVVLTATETGRVVRQVTSIKTTKIEIDGEEVKTTTTETIDRKKWLAPPSIH